MRLPRWVVLVIGGVFLAAIVLTQKLPYQIVPPLVVGWLVSQFVSSPKASSWSKRVVVLVTVWATAALQLAVVPAIVTLAGVGVYVLLHHDITTHSR